jgi:hypothetical protein
MFPFNLSSGSSTFHTSFQSIFRIPQPSLWFHSIDLKDPSAFFMFPFNLSSRSLSLLYDSFHPFNLSSVSLSLLDVSFQYIFRIP